MMLSMIVALFFCPAPGDVLAVEQTPIEIGCVVPPPGPWRLVLEPAYMGMADDIGYAGRRIADLGTEVQRLERSLDEERERCATEVTNLGAELSMSEEKLSRTADLLAEANRGLEDQPSRLAWAGVGAIGVVAAALVVVLAVN